MPPWLVPDYERLRAALDTGRLGHALLIHGPAGWGQRELANALALALIARPCTGADCPDASTLAHPDLRWLAPEKVGGQIKIDEIRRLTQVILQTPSIAPRKVAVIDEAEAINVQAANALLKTLEEPPPDSHLLLVTSALAEMLPTIRSRCQLVAVRPVAGAEAMRWVSEMTSRAGGADTPVEALAFEIGHAPTRLLQMLEGDDEPLGTALERLSAGRLPIATVLDRWIKMDADLLLARWMRYLADALKARSVGGRSRLPALDRLPEDALHGFWEELTRSRVLVRSTSNPNLRMLFEALLLAWRDLHHASVVRPDPL